MSKVLKIRELGNPIIRKVAKAVSVSNIKSKKFQNFIADLITTCKAKKGVGIAANQVGESKRIFIVWSKPSKRYPKAPKMKPLVVINPKIIAKSKKMKKDWEGCLSIPGVRALVARYTSIKAQFIDMDGQKILKKFSGFLARIFQHEFDHINGIVFLDRTNTKDIVTEKEFKRIIKNS